MKYRGYIIKYFVNCCEKKVLFTVKGTFLFTGGEIKGGHTKAMAWFVSFGMETIQYWSSVHYPGES
jgi:hypothetical protein